MVAEALPKSPEAPLVLGLQPAALIDNVAPVDWSLLDQIPGDRGGSTPVIPPILFSLQFDCFPIELSRFRCWFFFPGLSKFFESESGFEIVSDCSYGI